MKTNKIDVENNDKEKTYEPYPPIVNIMGGNENNITSAIAQVISNVYEEPPFNEEDENKLEELQMFISREPCNFI
jgi:hypothetical protein